MPAWLLERCDLMNEAEIRKYAGLMKELDYGKGYVYAHDTQEKLSRMKCLPESLNGRRYYLPSEEGQEKRVKERLEQILRWKESG